MRLASCIVLAVLILSRAAQAAPPELSAEERAAFDAMRKAMQPGQTYALNLGSPQQYAYARAMARLSGASQALAAIEAARAGAPSASPAPVPVSPAGKIAPLNLIQYLASDAKTATTSLLSAVPGGTSSSTMMVSLLTAGGEVFASSPQYQELDAGKHFVATFSAPIPAGSEGGAITASAIFIDTFEGSPHFYSRAATAGPGMAPSQCLTGPNYDKRQSGAVPCAGPRAKCTNDGKKKQKDIVVCLGRKKGNCNYITEPSARQFPFTICGTATFPAPVDPALVGSYILDLQGEMGACPIPAGGQAENPLNPEFFSVDPTQPAVLRYCIPNTAVPPSGCIAPGTNLFLSLTVYAQVTPANGSKALATAVASSDPAVTGAAPFVARLPAISVTE